MDTDKKQQNLTIARIMKNLSITYMTLLISTMTFACSCEYGGNFINSSYLSPIVIKGKVVDMFYHFVDGKRVNSKNQEEFKDYLIKEDQVYFESIRVEVIELIKGTENRKIIEIYGGDGADCRAGVYDFEIGETFIFSLNYTTDSFSDLPNEKDNDFILRVCSETWIEFIPKNNEVRGQIKGKSFRRKTRKYSYDKLIRKIT